MRRGLMLNLISNVMFFISGYVLHYFLGNSMLPTAYGVVGTILTVLDFEYMFVSNGARQSLAGMISCNQYDIKDIVAKTLGFQSLVIIFFVCLNYFGAPIFATLFGDESLRFYFQIAGMLVVGNGLQVILTGINDGLQRFGTSALLSTFNPIAKLGTIPLIVFAFQDDPVLGVEIGFFLAVVATIILGCVLLVCDYAPFTEKKSTKIPFFEVANRTTSFSFFFIMVSLVLSVDTLIVKAVVRPGDMAGYYTGAMNFGKIAYYLLQAFSTVILPVVAQLVGAGEPKEALRRIQELVQLAFAFILPISVVISASGGNLLAAFYTEDFTVAAPALACLSLSNFFMGMTVILNMVLNSVKASRFSDVLSIGSLIVVIPVFVLAARFGGITAIATASVSCTGTAMVLSFIRTYRQVGRVLTRKTWIIIGMNVALWIMVYGVFSVLQISNLLVLAALYIAIYTVYVATLLGGRVVRVPKLNDLKCA